VRGFFRQLDHRPSLRRPLNSAVFSSARAAGGDPLEGVPHDRIAAHPLVDREIALEHRALRAEGVDADFDVRAPGFLEVLRGGWVIILEEG